MTRTFLRDIPKIAAGSASLLAAAYVGLSPRVAGALYANMLFHPNRYPEGDYDCGEIAGIKAEDVFFAGADGKMLHGWHLSVPGSTKTLLFSHGNTGNLTGRPHLLAVLLKCGASVFIYDYRGYGRSDGTPTVQGICDDGRAAFDHLEKERRLKASSIVLYGESLGAAVSCQVSATRNCAGMILQSGFSSLRQIGIEMLPLMKIYPSALFPRPGLDSAQVLEKNTRPLLIIHGEKDGVVPFSHARELYQRAQKPKSFMPLPAAAHNDICFVAADQFIDSVKTFLMALP